jgi:hypothetical protein
MIPDAVRQRLSSKPFRPFVLRLGSGETFLVRHPELVSISPGGRRLILWVAEERAVDIDLLLVESIREQGGPGKERRRSA